MIKVPADRLAAAVFKHLVPGVIRSQSKKQTEEENRKSS